MERLRPVWERGIRWLVLGWGVLAGAAYGELVYPVNPEGKPLPSKIGHFFGALRVDGFRPLAEFKDDMDNLIRMIKNSPKADGQERIYIHGEKEFEIETERRQHGIPLHEKVIANMRKIADELEVKWRDTV